MMQYFLKKFQISMPKIRIAANVKFLDGTCKQAGGYVTVECH